MTKINEGTEARCPTCGATHKSIPIFDSFNTQVFTLLRNNRLKARKSCILCIEKHVGTAKKYYAELLKAKDSGTETKEAKINIELNHLDILGEMNCAIEESKDYDVLYDILIKQEREYRYNGKEPDWVSIADAIITIKGT